MFVVLPSARDATTGRGEFYMIAKKFTDYIVYNILWNK